jgi:hypothetical protein
MTTGHNTPTPEEAKRWNRKADKWMKEVLATPGAAKAFLVKGGFITKSGKLAKKYR